MRDATPIIVISITGVFIGIVIMYLLQRRTRMIQEIDSMNPPNSNIPPPPVIPSNPPKSPSSFTLPKNTGYMVAGLLAIIIFGFLLYKYR